MKKKILATAVFAACSAAQAVVVRPKNTDDILVNPDMGLVMFHYSNRQWAYGQLQERGDVLDWFPGVSTIYFRLPWCLLEPQEGQYRWDIIDSYAAPWIAAGKQIGFRVTCCESRYTYATPEWVKDAGAKGWFFKMKMAKIYGKVPPGSETDIWEPDYGDPVFLKKLENFLKAMARRYDGKPYVAFMDIGTIGMWGEGHTRAYEREMKAQGRDPREAFHLHYELHRRLFPNTTLLCIDDQAGSSDPRPAAEVPLMKQAHDLGFGFRDDSILVFTPEMIPARLKPHPWWFHANWADYFAPAAPVFVEHEHYNLSRDRGAWSDEKLVESGHLASFCGTGNNVQFLSDTTGTRRWLPFEVDSIESPLTSPFDYDAIYAQAYTLYQQGFQYWFSPDEIRRMARHNEQFETVHSELELVDLHFRKPKTGEGRELVSATMALQMIGANVAYTLSKERIGQAFMRLGFEYRRKSSQRGYIAVHRSGLEMEEYRRKLAEEAMTDDSMTADS